MHEKGETIVTIVAPYGTTADEAFLIGGVEKTSCGDYFVWMRFDSRVEATFACVTFGTNIAKLGFVRPSHQHI